VKEKRNATLLGVVVACTRGGLFGVLGLVVFLAKVAQVAREVNVLSNTAVPRH
jgi:hypothetical protein